VNIVHILKFEYLSTRAAATLSSLMLILVTSLAILIPKPPGLLGWEVLVAALLVWIQHVRSTLHSRVGRAVHGRPAYELWLKLGMGQGMSLPFNAVGVCLALDWEGALYVLAAGAIMTFALSVLNAWVLLVESSASARVRGVYYG
jgi:modulator of FtsH protease